MSSVSFFDTLLGGAGLGRKEVYLGDSKRSTPMISQPSLDSQTRGGGQRLLGYVITRQGLRKHGVQPPYLADEDRGPREAEELHQQSEKSYS